MQILQRLTKYFEVQSIYSSELVSVPLLNNDSRGHHLDPLRSHISSERASWHHPGHASAREEIRILITKLLRYSRPEPTLEWLNRLPQLTRTLEEKLYDEASSFQEYLDRNTLKERLQQVIVLLKHQKNRRLPQTPLSPSHTPAIGRTDDHLETRTQCEKCSKSSKRNSTSDRQVPPPLPPAKPIEETDRTCVICLDQPRSHLIIPCYHFIACSDCIRNFGFGSECPMCRTKVIETKQVFTS
jgi:hypothetical protein